jgi:hypothetical protein
VISTRLISGQTRIHVIGDTKPGHAFSPVTPELEDTYFAAIGGFLGANVSASAAIAADATAIA